jgi:hypothetical protein
VGLLVRWRETSDPGREPCCCLRAELTHGTQVGALFRQDGHGLRDDYCISGPELQTMCDVVRTVPGVLGERMLGGGDKGAAGALVSSPPPLGVALRLSSYV